VISPAADASTPLAPLIERRADLLRCPTCDDHLEPTPSGVRCASGAHRYPVHRGLPLLFVPHRADDATDVTTRMRAFYEAHPFPDYEDLDSPPSLRQKALRAGFPRLVDEQIPYGARILEVGCGTGQFSNFLGTSSGREVLGTDLCINSLTLAEGFRRRHGLDGVGFLQMNLFRPCLEEARFDVVICNGVLHHTSAPFAGFASIVRLAKPGGLVVLGLYNRYGRVQTGLRQVLFRIAGDRLHRLDFRLRDARVGAARKQSWLMDQYRNPKESWHTIDEVLHWFEQTDVDFVSSVPKLVPFAPLEEDERLFRPAPRGSRLDHLLVQLGMLAAGGKEGGLFVMIGRRRGFRP
jgi:2-polyprenyl-3-methyl-5-hydroxy-6-metoxy-1,4-benzoquinol methylase